jgi:hypothetical protein
MVDVINKEALGGAAMALVSSISVQPVLLVGYNPAPFLAKRVM